MKAENLIISYIKPVLLLNQIYGNVPFTLKFKISKFLAFLTVSIAGIRLYATYEDAIEIYKLRDDNFSAYIRIMNRILLYLGFILFSLRTTYKVKSLEKIILNFKSFDIYISRIIKIKYNNSLLYKYVITRLIFYWSLAFMRVFLFQQDIVQNSFFYIFDSIHASSSIYVHNMIFVCILKRVSGDYELLTKALVKNSENSETVAKILYASRSLNNAWEFFYDFYTFQTFLYSILVYTDLFEIYKILSKTIFYTVDTLVSTVTWDEMVAMTYAGMTALGSFVDTKQQVDACEDVKRNVKDFSVQLSQIHIRRRLNQQTKNLIRVHFAMYPSLEFDSIGFYKVDTTLVFSMLASAVSYMIILLQFEKARRLSLEKEH